MKTKPRVLDVGQCNFDHANVSRLLNEHFDVIVDRADSVGQVFQLMDIHDYDLVLVNRIFDADGTEGLEVIRRIKKNAATQNIPVMLVSNYRDAQDIAVSAGAVPGFGKADLNGQNSVKLIAPYLQK